jgi:hypothetical protein
MINLQTLRLSAFVGSGSRKDSAVKGSRLLKMAGIVFLFCIATAIAPLAQTAYTALANGAVDNSPASFIAINAPGAGTGAHQGTIAVSINTGGTIVGTYADAKNVLHGFLRNP